MSESNATSSGVSGLFLLGVAFVVLRLCGTIDWSWWLVTLPFWGPLAIGLAVAGVCVAIAGLAAIGERRGRTWR